jgi:hypothetical protein
VNSLCLTDDELLEDLTGSPLPSLQMQWLDAQRWIYVVSRRGRPRVARAYAEQRMGVQRRRRRERRSAGNATEPDWRPPALRGNL